MTRKPHRVHRDKPYEAASAVDNIAMAKQVSVVVCNCGNLYVRLHGADAKIFAAGVMDRKTAFRFMDDILSEFGAPSAHCEEVH
jgi:hypothetical protein